LHDGDLKVISANLEQRNSFLSYIYEDCKLNFMIGLDFTNYMDNSESEIEDY
jgi:hypothetical protein